MAETGSLFRRRRSLKRDSICGAASYRWGWSLNPAAWPYRRWNLFRPKTSPRGEEFEETSCQQEERRRGAPPCPDSALLVLSLSRSDYAITNLSRKKKATDSLGTESPLILMANRLCFFKFTHFKWRTKHTEIHCGGGVWRSSPSFGTVLRQGRETNWHWVLPLLRSLRN